MTVYPGPLGRAVELQAFSLRTLKGCQSKARGNAPGTGCYPGPLGRAVELQAFSLRHPEGVPVQSPGQRPGYKRGEKMFRTL